MKPSFHEALLLFLSGAVLLATGTRARASQIGGGTTQAVCAGTICGGNGGQIQCSNSEYCYRVKPNGNSVTSFDVGVEDGDINHYTNFCGPSGWTMSIVAIERAHDVTPTDHGTVSSNAGTCPFVLRFSGSAQTSNFEVGYSYSEGNSGYHDVHWKAGSHQSGWSFPVGTNTGPVHSPIRLNVLLIVLDDVGTDKLSLFDNPSHTHPHAYTPRLAGLAADGIKFTNYYVNPVCSTTRACLQTGRYAFNHGIGALSSGYMLPDCEVTIAELLKSGFEGQGYASAVFGKYHVTPLEYTLEYETHAVRNGYDRFFGTLANTGNHFGWVKVEHDESWIDPLAFWVPDSWSAEVVREDATEWIAGTTQPFFAYVAFNPPHAAHQVPPFETDEAEPRELLSEDTIDELEESVDPECDTDGIFPGDFADCPEQTELFYRAMLEAVDSEIGYLLDDMDDDTLRKTVVFVVCDNGTPEESILSPHDPTHGKTTLFQLGVRVPMIASGPMVATGTCSAPIGAVDLWQTIADITGADADLAFDVEGSCDDLDQSDSVSFLPLLQNPAGTSPRLAFSQGFIGNGVHVPDQFDCLAQHGRAVTDGTYKYIRNLDQEASSCPPCAHPCEYVEHFFKIDTDPEETTDLHPLPPNDPLLPLFNSMSAYMDSLD